MTNHYIILKEAEILNKDISPIKTLYDKLISFSDQLQKHENSIEFRFENNMGMLDFIDYLSKPHYKEWFNKVNAECPNLPYFLSGDSFKSSLSIYFLGCLPFEKQAGKLVFDDMKLRRFLEQKQLNIKNLCLGSNIDPKQTISRMHGALFGTPQVDETLPEHEKRSEKKRSLKTLLNEYGSVVYVAEESVRGALLLDSVYEQMAILDAHIYTGGEKAILRIYYSLNDQKTYSDATIIDMKGILKTKEKNSVLTLAVITKSDDEYQRLFERQLPSFDITDELPPQEEKIGITQKDSENTPSLPTETPSETSLPKEQPMTACEKENKALKKEIKSLNTTIEAMEEELNAPRSGFGAFFSKLFK